MVAQSLRTDRVELRAAIEDLRTSVERSAVAGGATAVTAPAEAAAVTAPAAAAGGSLAPPLAGGGTVVAGPTSYHLPGCNLLEAQTDVTVISLAEAKASGRVPCRVCQPADSDRTRRRSLLEGHPFVVDDPRRHLIQRTMTPS